MPTTIHPVSLPSGVTIEAFRAAVAEFEAVLGSDHVITQTTRIHAYAEMMLPTPAEQHMPSAALRPKQVEEIQKIVAICNRYRLPIWTFSTGQNTGYGNMAPAEAGQVVLDLRRMNRIIELDADLCYALVEPGVTYKQLLDYIDEHDLPVWIDPSTPADAGPLGNTCERGVGYTPYGEHFLFSCGMEVVLADGEVLRTGMGAVEGSDTWQVFKWGYGPYLDGLFTQSNLGIVTKMGVWLMPAPPAYKPFMIRYEDPGDIVEAIETIRPLRISNIIPNAVSIASSRWEIAVLHKRREIYDGAGPIPDAVFRELARERDIPAWSIYAALYGTPEQIDVNFRIISGAFGRSGRATILTENALGDDPIFRYRSDYMKGRLNPREYGLNHWIPGGGAMWFSPVTQARGSKASAQIDLAKSILNKHGFDYIGQFIVGWRDMHHIVDLLFDRQNPDEMAAAHRCYGELITEFAKVGLAVYRTNIAFMDRVAEVYGPVIRGVNRRIKRALDPNGILAPGKSGIWVEGPGRG